MITYKTITIPEPLYARAQKLAQSRQEDVKEVIVAVLDEGLPPSEETATDDAANREMAAYIALHPQLKKDFFGKHVAILNGKLIDYDDDFAALYQRIDQKYPDTFVWLTTVREEPIQTLYFRSPRFIKD